MKKRPANDAVAAILQARLDVHRAFTEIKKNLHRFPDDIIAEDIDHLEAIEQGLQQRIKSALERAQHPVKVRRCVPATFALPKNKTRLR